MKKCSKCKEIKHLDRFGKDSSRKDGLRYYCNDCKRGYDKKWLNSNREHRNKYMSQYYKNNPELGAFKQSKRRSRLLSATPSWSQLDKIKVLYEKAKWLEALTGMKYHVDHIIPLQGKDVCGLHVWDNLQILEASTNLSKGNKR